MNQALIEWAEKAGQENIHFHIEGAAELKREASTSLTLLLAGLGGCLAYAVKAIGDGALNNAAIATAALALYFMLLAAVLVDRCLLAKDLQAPWNEPMNLYQPDHALDDLKETELENLQQRIELVQDRNNTTAYWLNAVRLLAIVSPLFWVAAYWLARVFGQVH